MILNKDLERKILNNRKHTIEINDKKYYVKEEIFKYDGVELVVEELAKIVGIKSIKSERVVIDGTAYYLSEDLNGMDGKKFETAEHHIRYSHTLNEIFDVLQSYYPDNVIGLMDQIVKMFIFDTITMNQDRNYSNWGFLIGKHGLSDVVILDNNYSFIPNGVDKPPMRFGEHSYKRREDLFAFLESSSPMYMDMFKDMYDVLTPELVSDIFSQVEYDNNMSISLKDIFLNNYKHNYDLLGEMLRGKNL